MIPFTRVLKYGNSIAPAVRVVDFFMSSSALPTMLVLLSNGEVWGSASTGNNLGQGSIDARYGKPYFVIDNVKRMYPYVNGIFIITNDNRIMYTGWQRSFNGASASWTTFQDQTSYYSGLNIANIKKVCPGINNTIILMNNGDVYGHGRNSVGELGFGDTTPRYVPTLMRSGATEIWETNSNTYIQYGRSFYGCGDNSYQQLGITGSSSSVWVQLFKAATDDPTFEINAFRPSQANTILYGKNTNFFFANGRNWMGMFGIGNVSIDSNVTNYKAGLNFTVGDLGPLFAGREQMYWTNIVLDSEGNLRIAGTLDGGGGSNSTSFRLLNIGGENASAYKCGISTRSYAVMDCGGLDYMWACGTTSSDPAGFTPLSTPLKHTWTHITDFTFNREGL